MIFNNKNKKSKTEQILDEASKDIIANSSDVEEVNTLDMTPDKSLMLKMGQKNYTVQQALAELIDNAVDARIKGMLLRILIDIDLDGDQIIMTDNAKGMNEHTFKLSAILGSSSKVNQLGKFGLGLKSACMNLASNYSVITSEQGSNKRYSFHFDEEDWMKDSTLTWTNHPYYSTMTHADDHGTKIVLEKLKISKSTNQRRLVTRIIDDFSFRYGRLIEDGELVIEFTKSNGPGTEKVHARSLTFEEESKIDFEFLIDPNDPSTKISGTVGLNYDPLMNQVVGSQSGKYGLTTYRNKRLITEWDDMKVNKDLYAIRRHPTWAAIIGIVDMDCVPVEADKRGFIQESPYYTIAVEKIREYVKQIEAVVKSREKKSKVSADIQDVTQEILEVTEEAIQEKDFKDLVSKYASESDDVLEQTSSVEEVVVKKRKRRTDEVVEDLKEVRERLPKVDDEHPPRPTPVPTDDPHVRQPREKSKVGEVLKVVEETVSTPIEVEAPTDETPEFKIRHWYVDGMEGDMLRSWEVLDDEILVVRSNIHHFQNSSGKDYPVFALWNVCECYAEYILGENATSQNIIIIRDDLIKRYYKILNSFDPVKLK